MKKVLLCALVALTSVACRPDTVALEYQIEAGAELVYRIDAHAEASWDIGGSGEGSYDVSFEVTERVRSVDDDGAVVDVEMQPLDATERGLPSPGLESRSFRLRLGPGGEVLEILNLDGITASALDPEQLAFIGTYRPALPEQRVRLDDTWAAQRPLDIGATFQQLESRGRLRSLDRDQRGAIALIAFEGRGPLLWETRLPQGEATLRGTAATRGSAEFDIEDGLLRSAHSLTGGDFEVRVLPGGGAAPISGTLHLELELEVDDL